MAGVGRANDHNVHRSGLTPALFLQKVKALLADKWSNDATTNFSTVVRFDFAGGMGRKTHTKPAKSGTTR